MSEPSTTLSTAGAEADYPRPISRVALAWWLLAAFAVVKLGAHLVTVWITPYSVHRDEFLYLAMGQHLRFWCMDFPPAIAVLAKVARAAFGDGLFAVRLFPALAGTGLMLLAGVMARELGGGKWAQGLAMTCVLAGTLFLRTAALFQPVVLDQLCWSFAFLALLKYAQTRERRWWLWLGVAAGFGLLTKFSILFLGFGMLVAVALSQWRRSLATPWPYVTVLVALAIGSPTLVGQVRLDFPVVIHMHDLRQHQLERVSAPEYLIGQVLMLGPAVLVALLGVVYLLRSERLRDYRLLAYSCVFCFVLLLVLHGKPYYIGPIYPVLFAAGATALERVSLRIRQTALALILGFGVLAIPFGLPVVPPAAMARYAARFGPKAATMTNRGEFLPLPQDYADMIGWEQQVSALAQAYHGLPPEKRNRAIVVASNYGQAGAIEFFGPRYGLRARIWLPRNRTLWPPGGDLPEVIVALGVPPEDAAHYFNSVQLLSRFDHPWMVTEERHTPILVADTPRPELEALWPRSKL